MLRAIKQTVLIVILATLAACRKEEPLVDSAEQMRIAGSLQALVRPNARVVLYSLDPNVYEEPPAGTEIFRGYRVLGRAEITDPAEREGLVKALSESARKNRGVVALCFNPRHGLHIEGGDAPVDLAICFECLQVYPAGFNADKPFIISEAPEPLFDASLKKHGLPKSEA
ncbi:MAG TPA: hypothetical protein VM940_15140 [Chthoniobacterales bacterium]|jgi:hypothetical protein|nr:hypothetical protein [Chthoniobacterales bacterium]